MLLRSKLRQLRQGLGEFPAALLGRYAVILGLALAGTVLGSFTSGATLIFTFYLTGITLAYSKTSFARQSLRIGFDYGLLLSLWWLDYRLAEVTFPLYALTLLDHARSGGWRPALGSALAAIVVATIGNIIFVSGGYFTVLWATLAVTLLALLYAWHRSRLSAKATAENPRLSSISEETASTWPMPSRTDGVVHVDPRTWKRGGPVSRRPILVVDDTNTNLLIVENILTAAGYEVETVNNAKRALDKLLEGDYRLAIIDMHMPGMSGVDLVKHYRTHRPRRRTPIMFLTASTSLDATQECADAGADAFLTKPVRREILLGTVNTLLKNYEINRLHPTEKNGRILEEKSAPLLNTDALHDAILPFHNEDSGSNVIRSFGVEIGQLLGRLQEAVAAADYARYIDILHAIRTSAVNVGALALAESCRNAEAIGILEFRNAGGECVAGITEIFQASLLALEKEVERCRA
jgi:CheY-like chemotaxis protein